MTAPAARRPTRPGVPRRPPARGERQVFAQLSGVCVQSLRAAAPRLSPANTLSPAGPAARRAGTPRPAALIRPALIRTGGSGGHRHFPAPCPPPIAPRIRSDDGVAVRRAPTGGGRPETPQRPAAAAARPPPNGPGPSSPGGAPPPPFSPPSRPRPQPPALAARCSSVCPGLLPLVAATQPGTHVLTWIPRGWQQEAGQEFLNTTTSTTTSI